MTAVAAAASEWAQLKAELSLHFQIAAAEIGSSSLGEGREEEEEGPTSEVRLENDSKSRRRKSGAVGGRKRE